MSRVYWHSPSGEVELLGAERHYAAKVVDDLALAMLSPTRELMEPLLAPGHYLRVLRADVPAPVWEQHFRAYWRVGDETLNLPDGTRIDPWMLTLNTAIDAGSDHIELLARLHATCEVHGYVEGEHRAWLAEIIEDAREAKVLRPYMGWADAIRLLNERDDEPVVMSYSVTESFPNPWELGVVHAGETEADELAAWQALGTEGQWERGMEWLRARGLGSLDIGPDMWGVRGFGAPALTVFDLLEMLHD